MPVSLKIDLRVFLLVFCVKTAKNPGNPRFLVFFCFNFVQKLLKNRRNLRFFFDDGLEKGAV